MAPFPAQAGGSAALGWLGSSEHFHRYRCYHRHCHHYANSCHQRRLVSDYTKFGQVENTFQRRIEKFQILQKFGNSA